MTSEPLRAAIRAIYREVSAPDWAAANLDGLADILRDLSWLPTDHVQIVLPALDDLSAADRRRLLAVLARSDRISIR